VLSFHGGAGTGKTFVARIIAEAIYKRKNSQYVHFFVSSNHFPSYGDISLQRVRVPFSSVSS
jgi:DNA replication protein DnaC